MPITLFQILELILEKIAENGPKITVSDVAPSDPALGDLWIETDVLS